MQGKAPPALAPPAAHALWAQRCATFARQHSDLAAAAAHRAEVAALEAREIADFVRAAADTADTHLEMAADRALEGVESVMAAARNDVN